MIRGLLYILCLALLELGRSLLRLCLVVGLLAAIEVYAAQLIWPETTFPDTDTAFLHVAGKAGGRWLFVTLNLALLVEQLFGTPISTFFAVDLIITAVVFWIFLYQEARRLQMSRWWVYLIATVLVGPSFALPLFLYFREARLATT